MALRENRIVDGEIKAYDKVQVAIDRLKAFEPPEGYWLAFSGGKDDDGTMEGQIEIEEDA